jgi:hypothetical protein
MPLGIQQQMIENSTDNSSLEQSEWYANQMKCWTVRRSLGCQEDFEKQLAPGKWEAVPGVIPMQPVMAPKLEPNESIHWGLIQKDSQQCRWGPSHEATKETNTSWSLWIILPSDQKPMTFRTNRFWRWRKCWLPTSSSASEYCRSYAVTRAVTLNPIWYSTFQNIWEVRHYMRHSQTSEPEAVFSNKEMMFWEV